MTEDEKNVQSHMSGFDTILNIGRSIHSNPYMYSIELYTLRHHLNSTWTMWGCSVSILILPQISHSAWRTYNRLFTLKHTVHWDCSQFWSRVNWQIECTGRCLIFSAIAAAGIGVMLQQRHFYPFRLNPGRWTSRPFPSGYSIWHDRPELVLKN